VSVDQFGRWLSWLGLIAIAFAVVLLASIYVLSLSHFIIGAYALVFFCIGLTLKYASAILHTNPRLAIALTSSALYVVFAGTLLADLRDFQTGNEIVEGAAGVVLGLVDVAIIILVFLFLRKAIANVKGRLLASASHREN
jgi:hypothetical protein